MSGCMTVSSSPYTLYKDTCDLRTLLQNRYVQETTSFFLYSYFIGEMDRLIGSLHIVVILLLWNAPFTGTTETLVQTGCPESFGITIMQLGCVGGYYLNVIGTANVVSRTAGEVTCPNPTFNPDSCQRTNVTVTAELRYVCNGKETCYASVMPSALNCGATFANGRQYFYVEYRCIRAPTESQVVLPAYQYASYSQLHARNTHIHLTSSSYPLLMDTFPAAKVCEITLSAPALLNVEILELTAYTTLNFQLVRSKQPTFCVSIGDNLRACPAIGGPFPTWSVSPEVGDKVYFRIWPTNLVTGSGRYWIILSASTGGEITVNCDSTVAGQAPPAPTEISPQAPGPDPAPTLTVLENDENPENNNGEVITSDTPGNDVDTKSAVVGASVAVVIVAAVIIILAVIFRHRLAPLVPPQPSCCPSKPSGDAANDNISYLGAPKCLNNDGVFIHPSVAFTKASSEGVVVSDVTGSSLPASRHGNTPQILRNPEDTLPQPPQPLPSTGLSGVDSENIHFQHPHPPSYSHPHPPPSPPSDLYLTIE